MYQPVAMLALDFSGYQIALIVVLVLSLVVTAFRMARMASKLGRNPVLWFVISLFLTALPATIVFWRDQMQRMRASQSLPGWSLRRRRRGDGGEEPDDVAQPPSAEGGGEPDARQAASAERCPHCGSLLEPGDIGDGLARCPQCDLPRSDRYA